MRLPDPHAPLVKGKLSRGTGAQGRWITNAVERRAGESEPVAAKPKFTAASQSPSRPASTPPRRGVAPAATPAEEPMVAVHAVAPVVVEPAAAADAAPAVGLRKRWVALLVHGASVAGGAVGADAPGRWRPSLGPTTRRPLYRGSSPNARPRGLASGAGGCAPAGPRGGVTRTAARRSVQFEP